MRSHSLVKGGRRLALCSQALFPVFRQCTVLSAASPQQWRASSSAASTGNGLGGKSPFSGEGGKLPAFFSYPGKRSHVTGCRLFPSTNGTLSRPAIINNALAGSSNFKANDTAFGAGTSVFEDWNSLQPQRQPLPLGSGQAPPSSPLPALLPVLDSPSKGDPHLDPSESMMMMKEPVAAPKPEAQGVLAAATALGKGSEVASVSQVSPSMIPYRYIPCGPVAGP